MQRNKPVTIVVNNEALLREGQNCFVYPFKPNSKLQLKTQSPSSSSYSDSSYMESESNPYPPYSPPVIPDSPLEDRNPDNVQDSSDEISLESEDEELSNLETLRLTLQKNGNNIPSNFRGMYGENGFGLYVLQEEKNPILTETAQYKI